MATSSVSQTQKVAGAKRAGPGEGRRQWDLGPWATWSLTCSMAGTFLDEETETQGGEVIFPRTV